MEKSNGELRDYSIEVSKKMIAALEESNECLKSKDSCDIAVQEQIRKNVETIWRIVEIWNIR